MTGQSEPAVIRSRWDFLFWGNGPEVAFDADSVFGEGFTVRMRPFVRNLCFFAFGVSDANSILISGK